jgi:hypothetical protein
VKDYSELLKCLRQVTSPSESHPQAIPSEKATFENLSVLAEHIGDFASFQNLFLRIARLSVRVKTTGKVLSIMELRILDRLVKINSATQPRQYMLSHYLT